MPAPSFTHEGLVELFRGHPALAPHVLRELLGIPLPAYSQVRVDSADLTDVQPAALRADLVVLLLEGKPVFGIVVEVQLALDPAKAWSWPAYVVTLRRRLQCPVCLLVYTPSEAVARWAAQTAVNEPGLLFQPCVLGPEKIPVIVDVQQAAQDPELAVLCALAHAQSEQAPAVALAALSAVDRLGALDADRSLLYHDPDLQRAEPSGARSPGGLDGERTLRVSERFCQTPLCQRA